MSADPNARPLSVAVIGAGPAGLIAAEALSGAGAAVTVFEALPSVGRKFLMAGRGGLNLTHSEPFEPFLSRYGEAASWMEPMLRAFPPEALRMWAEELGQATFVGSSGRIFPKALKASPLLRAWLARLETQGVKFRTRTRWRGWDEAGALVFDGAGGVAEVFRPDATLLALGGASWPRLGSDGGWAPLLAERGVELAPFRPSNGGFDVEWSPVFRTRFEGTPLKTVALTFARRRVRGEAMISRWGLEGGGVYALSAPLRDAIEQEGHADLWFDLRPDLDLAGIELKLSKRREGETATNLLRRALNLTPGAIGLMREAAGVELPVEAAPLARLIKGARVRLTGVRPIDRAISSAGGVRLSAVDQGLMLAAIPGVWVAGEMLDWEAPTGGYLLQACFATGLAAARALREHCG